MSFTARTIEELADWCANSSVLANVREKARCDYFGRDDPRPIAYVEGTGDYNSRERRFMGWFAFNYMLQDGQRPAEIAAVALLT